MITYIGADAQSMLDALLSVALADQNPLYLEEERTGWGLWARVQEVEARLLFSIVEKARERLGRLEEANADRDIPKEEKLVISRDYRIFLPERGGMEIKLGPLPKAVFILYLKHPEGIRFKDISLYRKELSDIYLHISPREDKESVERSIDRLVEPLTNSLSVNCSRLATGLAEYFNDATLPSYLVTGSNGEKRRIPLRRALVIWK